MSETATKKKEPGMATLVIVLFAICAATALLLGLTNYVTAPFIAANNEKTTQEAMAAVLPADSYDEVEYTGGDAMVQAVYKAGDAGYVVEVKPATSFSGNLTIMVGVDNTGACSGISITSTGETSGLGSNASKPDFQAQFVGKTGEVKVTAAAKLAEVAVETAKTAKLFGIDPKVAVLSFSTKGSGKGGTVALSHDAVIKAQEMDPELAVDGELQFDAAVAPEVAQVKCKGSKVAGQANTFIFPCIEAGNIGYKIAQRLGGYAAYGPILQGLNAPINDLSRGCNADEVYKMSLITACQS